MTETTCKHRWTALFGSNFGVRQCGECKQLARMGGGVYTLLSCSNCTAPATLWRLGSPFCETHLVRPGGLKTLREMSEDEIKALEKRYGVPVKRPT